MHGLSGFLGLWPCEHWIYLSQPVSLWATVSSCFDRQRCYLRNAISDVWVAITRSAPMLDNETIVLHVTRIDGKSYRNDYTVMWRGLPVGRIRKNPGLPAHIDQWSWGCNVYGQPSLSSDSGQGTDLENCKAKFKIASLRIRARLTDRDIAKAQKCGEGNCPANAVHRRGESPPKPAFSEGETRMRPVGSK